MSSLPGHLTLPIIVIFTLAAYSVSTVHSRQLTCTVRLNLNQLINKPLHHGSSYYTTSCLSLHHLAMRPCYQVSTNQTSHLSAKAAVTASLSSAAATAATEPSPASSASFFAKESLTTPGRPQPTLSAIKTGSGMDLNLDNPGTKAVQDSGFSKSASFQPPPSSQHHKTWKESGEIKTAPKVSYPSAIAIHPNGDIAVTSPHAPVTVFSQNGDFKHVMKGSPSYIDDIAITPSNQYIIPGKDGNNEVYIYNDTGVLCKTIKSKSSSSKSVTVDSTGRILVGFFLGKTVCIHQPDGTLISKFRTRSSPRWLTCTPDDRLTMSFVDMTLQVMDQSGHNVTVIQPPPGIQSWWPQYVRCSKQGELFVSITWGYPRAVYRYVSTGGEYKYLDCIAVEDPRGIALSADEEKLFVVDNRNHVIKMFQ